MIWTFILWISSNEIQYFNMDRTNIEFYNNISGTFLKDPLFIKYLFMENLNVHWFIKWKDIEIT